jgi:HPt (histidine-containing phosphotransfer) domain-containing protein
VEPSRGSGADVEAPSQVGTPPDLSLLDRRVIAQLIEDLGRESVIELLGLFQTESDRRRQGIEAAVAAGDPAAACHEAHALKGSSLTFGACKLGALALAMEQAGRRGDLEDLAMDLPTLARLTAETQVALSSVFAEDGQHHDH